jgi:hypothetical protein
VHVGVTAANRHELPSIPLLQNTMSVHRGSSSSFMLEQHLHTLNQIPQGPRCTEGRAEGSPSPAWLLVSALWPVCLDLWSHFMTGSHRVVFLDCIPTTAVAWRCCCIHTSAVHALRACVLSASACRGLLPLPQPSAHIGHSCLSVMKAPKARSHAYAAQATADSDQTLATPAAANAEQAA